MMRLAPLALALSCFAFSCSNEKQPQPLPSTAASTAAAPSTTATGGGGTGRGKGKGGGRDEREWEKTSEKRADADWPAPGRYERTLEHDGMKRRYLVQIPPTHRKDKKAPLFFMLHGGGGTPEKIARRDLGISLMAARNGWIGVFPQGSVPHEEGFRWSHGLCPPEGAEKKDEVGFFRALIDTVSKDVLVDERRIYVMGFSSGGKMTQVLGAELADRLAAIAPIAGMSICKREGGEEERIAEPKEPMNALMMFGATDPGLPIGGGPTDKTDGKLITGSVDDMTAIWTKAAKCGDPVKKGKETDPAITIDYRCKETGKRVLTIILNKTGHAIPKKIGNRAMPSLVTRFLEGSFRKREETE